MSQIRGVLLAGQFRTLSQLNTMSHEDQRNTLIVELVGHTNQSAQHFQALDDAALAGTGAVAWSTSANCGIRTDAALKTMSDDDQRNTLIVEIDAQTHRGASLQALSNLELVGIGLGKDASLTRGVLLAGQFAHSQLNTMSHEDQRNTLIVELVGHTNQSVQHFQALDDAALAGTGAVMVYLHQSGIRTDAALKTMSDDDQRNTLIVAIDAQTHQGSALQGLSNLDLVRAGLGLATPLLAAQQIEQKYVQVGGRQSALGRAVDPRSGVRPDGAGFVKDYNGGRITFTSDGGASAFKTHRTVVRYRGMHCFGKSEGQDEPYAIVGVYGSDSRDKAVVQKFPVGRDSYTNFVASTDASESEEITLDWAPQTLVIVSTVMEHDSGDPDRVVAKVEESIKKAAIDARGGSRGRERLYGHSGRPGHSRTDRGHARGR